MRVIAIITARLDSRRLPRKHFAPLGRRPMIDVLATRMRLVPGVDQVVLATTERSCDDPLAIWARANALPVYRGAIDDVLGRFAAAAERFGADFVIKANGDSPLLSPEVAANGLNHLIAAGLDCATGKSAHTGLPVGLGVEVLSRAALRRLDRQVTSPAHRETITSYVFEPDSGFDWAPIPVPPAWHAPELELCLDTRSDLARLGQVFTALPPDPAAAWSVETVIETGRRIAAVPELKAAS